MQSRIEETSEFEAKIRNDPCEPMDTIELRMCGQVRAKHECVQPTDTPTQFLTLKQEHGETLGDCNKRFKQGQDNLKGILGDKTLNDHITKTDKHKSEIDADEKAEQTKTAFEKWCSHIHLKNCDSNEHGALKNNLQSQHTLGNDQCPSTVSEVTDVSTNHTWDDAHAAALKKRKEQPTGGTTAVSTATTTSTPSTEGTALVQKDLTTTTKRRKEKEHCMFLLRRQRTFCTAMPEIRRDSA